MDNTQTQMKLTPLMEASIALIRKRLIHVGDEELAVYDGIIDAFVSEIPQPIKLDLLPGQIIDCSPDDDSLAAYKAMLMALMQEELDKDPFCEAGTPHTGIQELLKRLGYAEARGDRLEAENNLLTAATPKFTEYELSLHQLIDNADGYLTSGKTVTQRLVELLDERAQLRDKLNPPIEDTATLAEPQPIEAKGPTPAVKKVDGRKKPAEDAHLSELAKLFHQKGVPGLGDLKKHLPQVARYLFGDGITSTVTIAKLIGISMSDAAALVKVAQACKEVSELDEGVDNGRFLAAISEVTE